MKLNIFAENKEGEVYLLAELTQGDSWTIPSGILGNVKLNLEWEEEE